MGLYRLWSERFSDGDDDDADDDGNLRSGKLVFLQVAGNPLISPPISLLERTAEEDEDDTSAKATVVGMAVASVAEQLGTGGSVSRKTTANNGGECGVEGEGGRRSLHDEKTHDAPRSAAAPRTTEPMGSGAMRRQLKAIMQYCELRHERFASLDGLVGAMHSVCGILASSQCPSFETLFGYRFAGTAKRARNFR
jgi:hypothetical protein